MANSSQQIQRILSGIKTADEFKKFVQSGAYQEMYDQARASGAQIYNSYTPIDGMRLATQDADLYKSLQKNTLTTDYQTSYDEAKAANESRYNEILAGYDKLIGDSQSKWDTVISGQAGMGNAEKADLMHNFDVLGSRQQQGLVNSGLSSTTIRPAVMQQNTTAMQRALDLVNERLQGQSANLQVGSLNSANALSQNKMGVMERRTDDYPDQSTYLELLKQYGNA